MADIKAADVSKLRKLTGAGMMDCKKALQESNGDFDKAQEIIREKGQAVASKRSDRDATEGVALAKVSDDGKKGVIVVLNCETDFVARNNDFINFAWQLVDIALKECPANLEDFKKLPMNGKTIEEAVTEQIGITGEKMELPYYDIIEAEQVVQYIHPDNKLAALVGFNKRLDDIQTGKDIAMQVAAMDPVAVDKDDVPQDIIEKEKEIGMQQARQEGKPEELVEKIAMGKLNKFFKESTLLNQEFTKESKKTVLQYLQEKDKDLSVTVFKRYTLKA